jgi:hypothetical protein
MEKDYQELMHDVGEKKFSSRFDELLKTINDFLQEAQYDDNVVCNERILYHVLLDYYSDIRRLKEFHDILHTKTDKVMAYLIFWIVRRKPIQYTKFSEDEKDIFVNERFACYLLINECLWKEGYYKINDGEAEQVDAYIDLLLYYFKYRQINPQVIELMIESFKIGRLFPIL